MRTLIASISGSEIHFQFNAGPPSELGGLEINVVSGSWILCARDPGECYSHLICSCSSKISRLLPESLQSGFQRCDALARGSCGVLDFRGGVARGDELRAIPVVAEDVDDEDAPSKSEQQQLQWWPNNNNSETSQTLATQPSKSSSSSNRSSSTSANSSGSNALVSFAISSAAASKFSRLNAPTFSENI